MMGLTMMLVTASALGAFVAFVIFESWARWREE